MNQNIEDIFTLFLDEENENSWDDFWDGVDAALDEMAETGDDYLTGVLADWYYYLMYDRCNEDNAGVYKPNIYIYPNETMTVDVSFKYPGGLTKTIPDYSGRWSVLADPDGMLHDGVNDWEYLFYECITDISDMELSEGYVISPEGRYEQLEALIAGYGFNEREVKDFADFWDEKLEQGVAYAAYPILTEKVDSLMPIEVTPAPDKIGRLWFGFQKEGIPEKEAAPVPFERNGYSVLEWGGLFIR